MSKKLRLAASAAILGWVVWQTDWGQVAEALGRLRVGLWLLAVGVYALTQVVSGWRWALVARPLGFAQPVRRFVAFYYVGMFFNLVLPTSVGGDVVRVWYLGRAGRRGPALLSVLADRGSGLAVLVALAALTLPCCPPGLPPWAGWVVYGAAAALAAGTLAAVAAPPGAAGRVGRGLASLGALLRLFLGRPGLLVGTALLSVAVQGANVLLVWLVGEALGVGVPLPYYAVIVPVVTLLTLVPVSLNGMGVREGCTALLLAPLGVSRGAALTLAFLWFAAFTLVSLMGVAFYLFGGLARYEVRADDDPVGGDSDQGRAGELKAAA